MNRGLAISGAVILGLAIIVPFAMLDASSDGLEDAIVMLFIVVPIAVLSGLLGLVLLIVGLSTGGRQQQQQQIVVVTGGQFCTGCGQPKAGGAFCPACGAAA